jgi:hypothetical protein
MFLGILFTDVFTIVFVEPEFIDGELNDGHQRTVESTCKTVACRCTSSGSSRRADCIAGRCELTVGTLEWGRQIDHATHPGTNSALGGFDQRCSFLTFDL